MDNTNTSVISRGGNQYLVTIGDQTQTVDLDGYTVMSDDDYNVLEAKGLTQEDMWCPSMWNIVGDNDLFFRAALKNAANYSGFNADDYIRDNA